MKRIFTVTLLSSICLLLSIPASAFHYFCGFETSQDTVGWRFATGRRISTTFVIGSATHQVGAKSLYVSADGGTTAGYVSTASGFMTVAYRKFTLAAGRYDIAFDLRMAGDEKYDLFRLAYFPVNDAGGAYREPQGAQKGSTFPPLVVLNSFTDDKGRVDFHNVGHNISGKITIPKDGDYWLAFYFKEGGGLNTESNPGVRIDNIQIVSESYPTDCIAKPSALDVKVDAAKVDVTWQGNAPLYELMYYNTMNHSDTTYTVVSGITTNTYSIPRARLSDGNYNFLVRSICSSDTGLWARKTSVLIYDKSKLVIDYLDLNASGVRCTKGVFDNPYDTVGVKDFGPESKNSMHTVHYRNDEYDRLTGNKLKTVPDGALASVRLSNWTEELSPSGSMEYSYRVTPESKVLLLRYAAVLQYEKGHEPWQQTRIHVEIVNSAGTLLSHCTEVDFNARDVDEANTRGWKTYQPKQGEVKNVHCPIKWLDWQMLGINLKDYVGQMVRVRITMYACVSNFHFAYAYFTLGCSRGDIEGMSCDKIPTRFTVPEGFNYRWYRMLDGADVPESQLSEGGRVFTPLVGDTCSYYVDLMYPENHDCRFTLNAYMLPRVPLSDIRYDIHTRNCQNIVDFTNLSAVYSYPKDEPAILRPDTIDTYLWDFGPDYGTSQEKHPQLVLPISGDTLTAILQTGYNNCYDTKEFRVEVPAIPGETHGYDTAYICTGTTVTFNGKPYDRPGDYTDTLHTRYGCDSILSLHLKVLTPDTIETDTLICSDDVFEFFGEVKDSTGTYTHHIPSTLGCDTLVYITHLTILDALDVTLADDYPDICSSDVDEPFYIPYTVTRGKVTAYTVDYDTASETVGLTDIDSASLSDTVPADHLPLFKPANIRPGHYSATVTLHSSDCGNLTLPLTFDILYPSSVITQRWNDVLAITNSEYNGGYRFTSYQWYLDDAPIDGQIRSNLYTSGSTLRFDGEYRALLTRADDGVTLLTCPYTPTEFSAEQYTEVSTVVFPGASVAVEVDRQAVATIYTVSGILYSEYPLTSGINTITMPLTPGIYILRVAHLDGHTATHRIVIR